MISSLPLSLSSSNDLNRNSQNIMYPWNLFFGLGFCYGRTCTGFAFVCSDSLSEKTNGKPKYRFLFRRLGKFTQITEEVCLLNCVAFLAVGRLPSMGRAIYESPLDVPNRLQAGVEDEWTTGWRDLFAAMTSPMCQDFVCI
jgi:hypothetical protein